MTNLALANMPFVKMHGLGNDFVVLDTRASKQVISPAMARSIADRRRGVGFDQLLILAAPKQKGADVFMHILNPDGSTAEACGNGTRCVADVVMNELNRDQVTVETVAGLLKTSRADNDLVTVDMGPARLDWQQIPLSRDVDTKLIDLEEGPLKGATAVNMGNPHAVFFVDDAEAIDLPGVGPKLETHEIFPERANIEVASLIAENKIRMRVWERGAGITQACGSGACATAVAAHLRGLTGRNVEIVLDGGSLYIEWTEEGRVLMTGPTAVSFSGVLDATFLSDDEPAHG